MAEKLILRNFGPIIDAEIDVQDMMVFIGAQSSGKSTLAKLITIFSDFNFRQGFDTTLIEELKKYNLSSFIKTNTYIKFESTFFEFEFEKSKESKFDYNSMLNVLLNINNLEGDSLTKKNSNVRSILGLMIGAIVRDGKDDVLLREIQKDDFFGLVDNPKKLIATFNGDFKLYTDNILKEYSKKPDVDNLKELARQVVRVFSFIRPMDSMYIPSERIILPLVVGNIAGLINNKISFPKYILQSIQEFEKALNKINSLDLDIIGSLKYKRMNGENYIYHNKNQKVSLGEASSGVQSILPIILLIESSNLKDNYINLNYVVEEPEINLYPEAQYQLTKYLVKSCLETQHKVQSKNLIITTHSPYVLASINNLLLAHKKGFINSEKSKSIIPEESWIDSKNFNAYEVKNGKVKRIFNKKAKLIDSNAIDDVSDIIMEDFKKLAVINA